MFLTFRIIYKIKNIIYALFMQTNRVKYYIINFAYRFTVTDTKPATNTRNNSV